MPRPRPRSAPRPGADEYGRTPLHYAAAAGDLARVRALLEAGASPTALDDEGWTPLHFAAQGYAASACEMLLAAGAAVDAVDVHGNTPLWRATFASEGRGAVITLLLRRGADPHRANAHGISPAELAATIVNFDIAQFFRTAG